MIELKQGVVNIISFDVTSYIGEMTQCDFIARQKRDRNSEELVKYHIEDPYQDGDQMVIDIDGETGEAELIVTISKEDTYKFDPGKFFYEIRFTDEEGYGPHTPIDAGVMKLTLFDE